MDGITVEVTIDENDDLWVKGDLISKMAFDDLWVVYGDDKAKDKFPTLIEAVAFVLSTKG